jgi:hypothetical protein
MTAEDPRAKRQKLIKYLKGRSVPGYEEASFNLTYISNYKNINPYFSNKAHKLIWFVLHIRNYCLSLYEP